jgi:hypothetical protein
MGVWKYDIIRILVGKYLEMITTLKTDKEMGR